MALYTLRQDIEIIDLTQDGDASIAGEDLQSWGIPRDRNYWRTRLRDRMARDGSVANLASMLSEGQIVHVSQAHDLNDNLFDKFPKDSLVIFRYYPFDPELTRNGLSSFSRYRQEMYAIGLKELVDPFVMVGEMLDADPEYLKAVVADTQAHYTRYPIAKKSGGQRWINAPSADLKVIQRRIKNRILYKTFPTKFAHGFVNKKSIVTNAQVHTGKQVIVGMDIKGFFDTITDEMVERALACALGQDQLICISAIAKLCTIPAKGRNDEGEEIDIRVTPQGAPTSPPLSNIVTRFFDYAMHGVARHFHAVYTRYADDLTFSGDDRRLPRAIPIIMKVANDHGFWINTKKTRVHGRGGRQVVTGLTVNDTVSVPRDKRMKFRAKLHHVLTGKIPLEYVNIEELRGYAQFINMANANQGAYFIGKVKEIEEMIGSASDAGSGS